MALIALAVQVRAIPLEDKTQKERVANDQLPLGEDGSLFLSAGSCEGPNEELHPGALPTCEPTCSNPTTVCPKVFFTSLDFVPCFCKKPLVRNEQTRECIKVSDCPK